MLEFINSPKDLKKLDIDSLPQVCQEIRDKIINIVEKNGGHLSANLGVVELIVALYYVFDFPKDKLIFDVGHQSYTHKILTERKELFDTLRKEGGLSGFPNIFESVYDSYTSGHAGSSVSAGLGYCEARDALGQDYYVICLVGDGALVNGVTLEALVNSEEKPEKFLVILNDNGMSISKNTSGLYKTISRLSRQKSYSKTMKKANNKIGKNWFGRQLKAFKSFIKRMLSPLASLELVGLRYVGVYDGNNVKQTVKILKDIKETQRINLLHLATTKGKGNLDAERNSEKYHGIGKHFISSINSFSQEFGKTLTEFAEQNKRFRVITAGMRDGTGLTDFSNEYPDRFIDVGIAEEHALTMSAGIALGGVKPYFVVYSTFLQRCYDQISIDICLQKLPVCICIDRAGLVGSDGQTHQGIFDLSYLNHIPNLTILSPKDPIEFRDMLNFSYTYNSPLAIRYNNGVSQNFLDHKPFDLSWEKVINNAKADFTILAVGHRMNKLALEIQEKSSKKINIINARVVKPLDTKLLGEINTPIITLEENVLNGGFGWAVQNYLLESNSKLSVKCFGVKQEFISHSTVDSQLKYSGLYAENIIKEMELYEKK